MTDQSDDQPGSGGPPADGWWIASDGQWYPPEAHPDAPPASPTPPAAVAPMAPLTPPLVAPVEPIQPQVVYQPPPIQPQGYAPPPGGAAPPYGSGPPQFAGQYPPGPPPQFAPAAAKPGQGMAISALILGIGALLFSLVPFIGFLSIPFALAGVGLGIAGWVRANKGFDGKGLSIAGVVTSVLALVVSVLWVTLFAAVDDQVANSDPFGSDFGSDQAPADGDLGSASNPYPFGQAHSRDPGFLDAGWTLSIDEVRTEGVPNDPIFGTEGETGTCVAVIGTATLDSLDSEELTSNPFSFPDVVLVAGGSQADTAIVECDTDGLEAEGLQWTLDIELAEGATVRWFDVFLVDSVEYDTVAIESTVYADS